MNILKQLFPLSFGQKDGVVGLVINIVIYLVVGVVAGVLIGILAHVPILGAIVSLVGGFVDLYVLVGIVLSVLDYLKLLK